MKVMETKEIFRNLVANQFMPGFDYVGTTFSFQTLFNKRLYSYKCCPCAFEHEYLECITESGDIDEKLYNRVLLNILNGKCPHVDEQQNHCIRETCVYGIYIAAAVGTEKAIKPHLANFSGRQSSIFQLGPYEIAAIKRKDQVYKLFLQATPKIYGGNSCSGSTLLYPKRSPESGHKIKIEYMSILEYFINTRNTAMFRSVLMPHITHLEVERAFQLTINAQSEVMKEDLTQYHDTLMSKGVCILPTFCAETALMYNQPNLLRIILNNKYYERGKVSQNVNERLTGTCYLLERPKCEEVLYLSKHGLGRPEEMSDSDQIKILLKLLARFYDGFSNEILCRLQKVPSVQNKSSSCLLNVLGYNMNETIRNLDSRVVKSVLDLVADIEINRSVATKAYSLLTQLMYTYIIRGGNLIPFRETLEVLLNENPELDSDRTVAVTRSLEIDQELWYYEDMSNLYELPGEYLMDGEEHSLFGHDKDNNFYLNFLAPLFIESGFPYERLLLLNSLELQLHPAEHSYLQSCLDTPRTLTLRCRDVLRRHFIGRQIHRFVEQSSVPKPLKDFLLMKPLLCNFCNLK